MVKTGVFTAPDFRSVLGKNCYCDFCKSHKIPLSGVETLTYDFTKKELKELLLRQRRPNVVAYCSPIMSSQFFRYRVYTIDVKDVPYPSAEAPRISQLPLENKGYIACEYLHPSQIQVYKPEFRFGTCNDFFRDRLFQCEGSGMHFYVIDLSRLKGYVYTLSHKDYDRVLSLNKSNQVCISLMKYNYAMVKGR